MTFWVTYHVRDNSRHFRQQALHQEFKYQIKSILRVSIPDRTRTKWTMEPCMMDMTQTMCHESQSDALNYSAEWTNMTNCNPQIIKYVALEKSWNQKKFFISVRDVEYTQNTPKKRFPIILLRLYRLWFQSHKHYWRSKR